MSAKLRDLHDFSFGGSSRMSSKWLGRRKCLREGHAVGPAAGTTRRETGVAVPTTSRARGLSNPSSPR